MSNVLVNPGVTATVAITVVTQHRDPDLGGSAPGAPPAPQIIVWRKVQTRTVPGASGPGMIQEEIYQQALLDTKKYMRDTVWPEFARMWEENPWSQLVPPE